jgi:hypothetical protein
VCRRGKQTPTVAAALEDNPVEQSNEKFGKRNPFASRELSRFEFLLGRYACDATVRLPSGEWQKFQGEWAGRYILDGYAIADEYRMFGPDGKLVVLGLNFRAYDAASGIWNIKWLNALSGTWTDLGPQELGGVTFDRESVTYHFKESVAGHAFTRATYTNISKSHFTWRGEMSEDRKIWKDFMVIEAERIPE